MGANTAFADAADLAAALASAPPPSWPAALATYEHAMLKRGAGVVRGSTGMTAMIHAVGWRAAVRDWVMWAMAPLMVVAGVVMRARA